MLETILIITLAVLVVFLSFLIVDRHRRQRGTVCLKEEALNELLTAMINNIRSGKIQDAAGKVSSVLKTHLGCRSIIFLKYYKGALELNYYHGLKKFNREEFRIRINPDLQGKLRSFHGVTPVAQLKSVLAEAYLRRLNDFELLYFFPVYLRENLYGLYFIGTDLSPQNRTLQFLATALAFNLSAAYHIGIQEQQLKRFEDRVKRLASNPERGNAALPPDAGSDWRRFLKIKNSRQLIPELINALRKDCEFSKMSFCVETDSADEGILAVSWNVDQKLEKQLKDDFKFMIDRLPTDKICDLKTPGKTIPGAENRLRKLNESNLGYLAAIGWVGNRKALLAWSGERLTEEISERLRKFRSEALPLVENATQYEKVEELSYTDGLTGMYNFRYFQKCLGEEFTRAKRYQRNLALLIFDIDDLKMINDKCGHLAGDMLLKSFGRALTASVRTNDVVCRYGGDEFCLIMPETDQDKARLFMERIREIIAATPLDLGYEDAPKSYSVSIGGAIYPIDADRMEALINAADMALLRAKASGGNHSCLYLPESPTKG